MITVKRAAYLLLSLGQGITWFTILVTGLSVGLGLAITLVGLPVLIAMLYLTRVMANVERALVEALLGVAITPPYRADDRPTLWGRIRIRLADPQTWKDLVFLFVQFPLGIVYHVVTLTFAATALGLTTAPAWYWTIPDGIDLGILRVDRFGQAFVLVPLGLVVGVLAKWVIDGLGRAQAGWARTMLTSTPDPELTARVDDLRSSQQRIIDAADAERRRLERDLHDGAQQRLVALSLKLGMAKERLGHDEAAATLVSEAHEESRLALTELRDLARGIHPAILTDRGLAPALEELAARATVPTRVLESPGRRLPGAVEAAAYFVVAECLTNVGKHAHATEASVFARADGERLVVEVSDDGDGGVALPGGSGLSGLADRVAALDGRVEVLSPEGTGTRVRVELPLRRDARA